jgi:hypothetical protein
VNRTTIARGTFLLRLRVQSDGAWVGQVERLPSGRKDSFGDVEQLVERLAAMVPGGTLGADGTGRPWEGER